MRARSGFLTLGVVLAAPGGAVAQEPVAQQQPKLELSAERVGPSRSVLAGTPWRVRGVLTPYVAGQRVTVRFFRGRSRIKVREVAVLPSVTGRSGYFLVAFRTRRPGRVRVRASHEATGELGTLVARAKAVRVLAPRAGPGSRGPAVRLLQGRLAGLGYVVGRRGLFDQRTARAVLAFRKVTGMARTSEAGPDVFRRLARGAGRFRLRFPSHGKHVEADLSRQVLVLARGGKVERIYPTSSGAPATPTILGSYRVYSKTPGYNASAMYFSSYFIRGYAIHGYASVPTHPASHGCLRVPIPDAISIFRWLRHGDRVDVYP